jgi:branched-chain amino acid transport system substrate-binding protein
VATAGSPHQPDGRDVTPAVRSVVTRINAGGGLLGRRIRLVERADDCTAAGAEAVARELVALPEGVRPLAVVGHVCSGAAIAASRVYAAAGIVMISPGARHPRLTDARPAPLVFRLAARDDRLAEDIGTLIVRRFPGRRIALVHDRSGLARGLADAIESRLRLDGIKPVLREAYVHGEKVYDPLVDRLLSAEAQVIVMPAQPFELSIMLARLAQMHSGAVVIAGDVLAVPDIEPVARRTGERLVLMLPWLESTPQPRRTAEGSREGARRSPTWTLAHAAVEAWINAVLKAGGTKREAFVRTLETEVAATIAGPVRFDTRGDVVGPSFLPWVWRDGVWRPLGP